jgi:hypothetical protein
LEPWISTRARSSRSRAAFIRQVTVCSVPKNVPAVSSCPLALTRMPTVLAGHVDDQDGPAVFFRLPELRLITCTGPWDSLAQSYSGNHVVFLSPQA